MARCAYVKLLGVDVTKEVNNEFIFDNRVIQRTIRAGKLSHADLEKRIACLPDLEDKCEDISSEIYGTKRPGLALTGEFSSNEQDDE